MKKTVIALALCLTVQVATAQSLENLNPVSQVSGTLAELGNTGNLVAGWNVQNSSSSEISVRAYRNVLEAMQGSENYFCWGVCFTSAVNISPLQAAILMGPGETNDSFYAHYKPNGNPGQAIIEYCFFNAADESDKVCHTVYYCVDVDCVVGVGESALGKAELGVFPNPLTGMGKLAYRLPAGATKGIVSIFSITGQRITEISVESAEGVIILNAADFENGMYSAELRSDGIPVFSSRFVVSH